jgi:hypothetical protein
MAAIIKILTALINDVSRATRHTLVWLPTLYHNMEPGRLRTSLSRNPRSTRTDEAKSHQSSNRRVEMKAQLFATVLAIGIATSSLAHADDATFSFGGTTSCSQATLADWKTDYGWWIAGYWSALNSSTRPFMKALNPQHQVPVKAGWTGADMTSEAIIAAVWSECSKDPHQSIQTATDSVYYRMATADMDGKSS